MEEKVEKAISDCLAEAIKVINKNLAKIKRESANHDDFAANLKKLVYNEIHIDNSKLDDFSAKQMRRELDFSLTGYILEITNGTYENGRKI